MFDPRIKPERGTYAIDRDHPLAQGLSNCWQFDEGAGKIAQDLTGPSDLPLAGSGMLWGPGGSGGSAIVASISTPPTAVSKICAATGSTFTVHARFWIDPALSNGASSVILSDSGGGDNGLLPFVTGGLVYVYYYWDDENSAIASDAGLPKGQWLDVVLSVNNGEGLIYTNGWLNGYMPGDPRTINSYGSGPVISVVPSRFFADSANAFPFAGSIDFLRIYRGKAMSPTEAKWIYAEPYAMFRTKRRIIHSVPAVAIKLRRTQYLRSGSRGAV